MGKLALRLGALALLPLSVLLAACGGSDSGSSINNGSSSSSTSASSAPAPAIDLTKDDLGRSVTPPAKATRVVAMSPSIVELMYAVGAVPVGRPSSADYPPEAKSVPGFGTSYQPNYEE